MRAIQKYGEVATRAREKSFNAQWKLEAEPEENARIFDYQDAGIFNLRCRRLSNLAACSRLACVFRSAGSRANPR